MSKDALEAVAQAAVRIAAERDRLTRALDHLRTTVQVIEPSATLQEDGTIQYEGGAAIKLPPPAPESVPLPEPEPESKPVTHLPAPEPESTPPTATKPEPKRGRITSGEYEWTPAGNLNGIYFGPNPVSPRQYKKAKNGKNIPVVHWTEKPMAVRAEQRKRAIFDWLLAARQHCYNVKGEPTGKGTTADKQEPVPQYPQVIAEKMGVGFNTAGGNPGFHQVSNELRELAERGIKIKVFPNHGRPPGATSGRYSTCYMAEPDAVFIDADGYKDDGTQTAPPLDSEHRNAINGRAKQHDPVAEEVVRDAIIELGEFNMRQLMEKVDAHETDRSSIVRWLADWTNKGRLQQTLKGWKYTPPTEAGAAAEYDLTNNRGSGTRQDISPVAGTGRPKDSSNKEVNELLAAARRQWGADSISKRGSQHFLIKPPDGTTAITISSTPGSARSLLQDKARLRKAGLQGV